MVLKPSGLSARPSSFLALRRRLPPRPYLLVILGIILAAALYTHLPPVFPRSDLISSINPDPDYDLPHLLGMQSYAADLQKPPPPAPPTTVAEHLARKYPTSLLALYRAIPSVCHRQPYLPHLRLALTQYASNRPSTLPHVSSVQDTRTLLIHLVSHAFPSGNNTSLSPLFIHHAVSLASNFSKVIVLPFATQGATSFSVRADLTVLTAALHRNSAITVSVHPSKGMDDDVYLMSVAANLLPHRGHLSALGALVSQGTVYHTPELGDYVRRNAFLWLLHNAKPAVPVDRAEQRYLLDNMGPVEPTCCRLDAFGEGDGEKIFCGNSKALSRISDSPCWVLSVGCGGRFEFEESVVKRSKCHVHTFDCTRDFTVPEHLKERVTLHKYCLGRENDSRKGFIGWEKVLDIGEKMSGFEVARMPAMAKMDIEGYEMPVLNDIMEKGVPALLPEQWAMEVHIGALKRVGTRSPETMAQFFRNMSSAGYMLAHRADNPYCESCSEVTLVMRSALPPVE